jgi:MFS family permease
VQTQPLGDQTWRLIFLVGALPAFCVFYLMRALEESERWMSAVRERRWEAVEGDGQAAASSHRQSVLSPWRYCSVPPKRAAALAHFLMSLATTTGWWAVSTWTPVYAEQLAKAQGEMAGVWGPRIALVYTLGGVIAYMSSGFLADWIGTPALFVGDLSRARCSSPGRPISGRAISTSSRCCAF